MRRAIPTVQTRPFNEPKYEINVPDRQPAKMTVKRAAKLGRLKVVHKSHKG